MQSDPSAALDVRGSLVQVEIGGKVYDARFEKQCHTCTHPARPEIEEKIILGQSYRDIAMQYSETIYRNADGSETQMPAISWMSIYNHFKQKHLPVERAVVRQILDERAQKLSESYDEQTARLVDGHALAQHVMQETHRRLVNGDLSPSVRDGLAAAKLIKELEGESDGGFDAEVWSEAMVAYFETAQRIMPPEMWHRFTAALAQNPVLLSIQRRLESTDPEPLDAEFTVDEGEKS